jgi:hypothetical protein
MTNHRLLIFLIASTAWGWGDEGHRLVTRTAIRLIASHPSIKTETAFATPFSANSESLERLSLVPDEWNKIPAARKTSSPTHYLDLEYLWPNIAKTPPETDSIPKSIKSAKALFNKTSPNQSFAKDMGTVPWRVEQFAKRMKTNIRACSTQKEALIAAGLLSHFIADATNPLHSTKEYDGVEIGQRGIHGYTEIDLVNTLALSHDLEKKVLAEAQKQQQALTFQEDWATNTFRLLIEGYALLKDVQERDLNYAIATFEEGRNLAACEPLESTRSLQLLQRGLPPGRRGEMNTVKLLSSKDDPNKVRACRRPPAVVVQEKSVAEWNEKWITERLALAAVALSEAWVKTWIAAGKPKLCPVTLEVMTPFPYVAPDYL